MQSWLISHALPLVLPLILGSLSFTATQWLKGAITALDKASPTTKQAVALTLSFVFAGIVRFAGAALPNACILGDASTDCLKALTDPNAMQVLLSFIIAHVMHTGTKSDSSAS